MGLERASVLLCLLCATQLPLLPAALRKTSPRIRASPAGEKRFLFTTKEEHVTLHHENGTSSVFVGAVNKLYYYDFGNKESYVEPFNATESKCKNSKYAQNYLTLVVNYKGKLMVCGTNACSPTCWNWVDKQKEPGIQALGLAPYNLEQNSFVLFYGNNIYSAISKNGDKLIRFRRVKGPWALYSEDSLWRNPKLIQGAIIKNEEAYKDKIYLFFQEDNPDWPGKMGAPRQISRVAQLCAGDGGGPGALSSAKWSTFLKSTLHCFDPATDRHFHLVQDVFVVRSENWTETKIYGLFSNEWGYSAVCVYSVGDITKIFETSPLLGFTGGFPAIRPGQCIKDGKETPAYTYKVAHSHPEMVQQVKPEAILFHNKNHYRKLLVHTVRATDEHLYNVLYLTTENGTIHKIVNLRDGPINILEIQPFQTPAAIQSIVLDSTKNILLVASENEVVELPAAMCGVYKDNCESCVMARDPYCGWANGKCTSVYTTRESSLQSLSHDVSHNICVAHTGETGETRQPSCDHVLPSSRYYLNCSLESHHATYAWFHKDEIVARCAHGVNPCTHFIDQISPEAYGTYSCVSQEDWFKQTLVTMCLTKTPGDQETVLMKNNPMVIDPSHFQKTEQPYNPQTVLMPPGNWANTASFSFWLKLLHAMVIFFLLK